MRALLLLLVLLTLSSTPSSAGPGPIVASLPAMEQTWHACVREAYMVIRGHGDRQTAATPAPAAGSIADVPPIFAQGPREMLDIMRELRDLGRRNDEDLSDIREAVRGLLDLARRMVDLLDRIEREQSIANRARRIGRDGA